MDDGWIGFIVGVFISSLFWVIITFSTYDNVWKDHLVEKGIAEYYLNKNNQRKWQLLVDRKEEN